MDYATFDRMARRLADGASRRDVVRGAFAAAAGSALAALGHSSAGADDVSSENCIAAGKRCGRGKRRRPCKKCCTKNVITDQNGRRRCSCVRLGNGCSNDSQCCEGFCDSGTCQTSGSVCVPLGDACTAGDTCCAGSCLEGTCGFLPACVPLGDACDVGDTCCIGTCGEGTCELLPACVPLGDGCDVGDICCDDGTCSEGTCQLQEASRQGAAGIA